jgi:hypothetical protein
MGEAFGEGVMGEACMTKACKGTGPWGAEIEIGIETDDTIRLHKMIDNCIAKGMALVDLAELNEISNDYIIQYVANKNIGK